MCCYLFREGCGFIFFSGVLGCHKLVLSASFLGFLKAVFLWELGALEKFEKLDKLTPQNVEVRLSATPLTLFLLLLCIHILNVLRLFFKVVLHVARTREKYFYMSKSSIMLTLVLQLTLKLAMEETQTALLLSYKIHGYHLLSLPLCLSTQSRNTQCPLQ